MLQKQMPSFQQLHSANVYCISTYTETVCSEKQMMTMTMPIIIWKQTKQCAKKSKKIRSGQHLSK